MNRGMGRNLRALLDAVRSSYWFVPLVMSAAAIALGIALVTLDAVIGPGWAEGVAFFESTQAEGAREVLSAIAASMITVAGVVFSIAIASVSYAASQYGPRLLTNFMRDVGNQIALGTFVATFLYCVFVLRTIRAGGPAEPAFVPQIAILVGILLGLVSTLVLIWFMHHVPRGITLDAVVSRIGGELIDHFSKRCKRVRGPEAAHRNGPPLRVRARTTGYLQSVDDRFLREQAERLDLTVWVVRRPGDFVSSGQAVLHVRPVRAVSPELLAQFQKSVAIGPRRTPMQDPVFLVDELVEIAARALSSGINDPFTAAACLDWLGAAAVELSRRGALPPIEAAGPGAERIVGQSFGFDEFVERGFAQMRPYVAHDLVAARHFLVTLDVLAESVEAAERALLSRQALLLVRQAERQLDPDDFAALRARSQSAWLPVRAAGVPQPA